MTVLCDHRYRHPGTRRRARFLTAVAFGAALFMGLVFGGPSPAFGAACSTSTGATSCTVTANLR